jgi:predicted site-specific integrase-resolvase
MENYLGGKETAKILGVHQQTLYRWEKLGRIETIRSPGGKRFYNVNKYIEKNKKGKVNEHSDKENNLNNEIENEKKNICYCRVSSVGQKEDLMRQIEYMKDKYPEYEIIKDIGSGINFNRPGLNKIIDMAINGKINKVVIAYKDRLTRFGYELIERLIKEYSNGEIEIINKKDKNKNEEIMGDMLQIMNVFVAKINGNRKYTKRNDKK